MLREKSPFLSVALHSTFNAMTTPVNRSGTASLQGRIYAGVASLVTMVIPSTPRPCQNR